MGWQTSPAVGGMAESRRVCGEFAGGISGESGVGGIVRQGRHLTPGASKAAGHDDGNPGRQPQASRCKQKCLAKKPARLYMKKSIRDFRAAVFGASGSSGFADLDGVVAGFEDDFGTARGAVLAFEMRIALVSAGGIERAAAEFGIDVAGAAVGLNFEARRGRDAE